jgi:hypothetical protein
MRGSVSKYRFVGGPTARENAIRSGEEEAVANYQVRLIPNT